jgi:prephenate dehydrogenase
MEILEEIGMAIQITIIGLGQIGASIGLALAERKDSIERVGHDIDPGVAKQAQKLGAVDRIEYNLPRSVEKADVVLLSIPVDQIRDTMEIIAADLKEGCVVLDTAPVKEAVAVAAGELIPAQRHYVGLVPVINPKYLHETTAGLQAAHADLFQDGLLAIVTPPGVASDAVKLAADLARLVGATPMFFDIVELDSLMAATHLLPLLMSAAVLSSTVNQPGWIEARKVAGRAFAEVTGPFQHLYSPEAFSSSLVSDRKNMLRVLDEAIARLQQWRDDIESQDTAAILAGIQRARAGRVLWWQQRSQANWAAEEIQPATEMPSGSSIFGRLFGTGWKRKPSNRGEG